MAQTGYPIDTKPVLAKLDDIAEMDSSATWGVIAAYFEEGLRGPVSIGIFDDNERGSGVKLETVIETFEKWFRDTPNEAQWIAEDFRKLADKLDSYTENATKCQHCGELYSLEILDHCNGCGDTND